MFTAGFDRLVRALDGYAAAHPEREVLIQFGGGAYVPAHAGGFRFKPDIKAELEAADAVVCHAGMTVLEPLRLGKRLVVVPRRPDRGEIVNDHQIEFARVYSARFGFSVVEDMESLAGVLDRVLAAPPPPPAPLGLPAGLHRELGRYLDSLSGRARAMP
jgi:UDP-N-acetylglucosamine transferase subunit ALG13